MSYGKYYLLLLSLNSVDNGFTQSDRVFPQYRASGEYSSPIWIVSEFRFLISHVSRSCNVRDAKKRSWWAFSAFRWSHGGFITISRVSQPLLPDSPSHMHTHAHRPGGDGGSRGAGWLAAWCRSRCQVPSHAAHAPAWWDSSSPRLPFDVVVPSDKESV